MLAGLAVVDRAVARHPERFLLITAPADQNQFAHRTGLLRLPEVQIPPGARVEFLLVEVLHVELQVGESPGDALVMAGDDCGDSGQRNARDIEAGRPQVCHIPDARERILQMHVVREQWLAGSRTRARDGPGVRAGLHLVAGPRREQEVHLPGVACGQHAALHHLVAIGGGERSEHVEADQDGIHGAPRPRLVAQQRELDRQITEVAGEERVDAARVCGQHSAIGRRHRHVRVFGNAPHPQAPGFAIRCQPRGADDLGQRAAREPAQSVHLEQAVLCGNVTLREQRVVNRCRHDVRDTETVARHPHSLADRNGNGAGCFG